jgi:hypothetical protein
LQASANDSGSRVTRVSSIFRPQATTVERSGFFVASLWAPLPPIGMLVGACLWVLLFPGTLALNEEEGARAGAVLIAVPLVYTALFGTSYVAARALYLVHLLSRNTLLLLAVAISLIVAAYLILSGTASGIGAPLSIVVIILSLLAAGSAVLVWWRVASTAKPIVPLPYEKRSMRRHSSRRSGRSAHGERTVEPVEVSFNDLLVHWDPNAKQLRIMHPDRSRFPAPLAEIGEGALHGMSSQEAAKYIGECFTRLIPDLRSRYEKSSSPDHPDRKDQGP